MIVEIDHILVAARDPDAAAADLAARLGLAPAGGGIHAAIGTRNALLSLAGPYLEVIGLVDGSPGTRERAGAHPIGAAVLDALASMPGEDPTALAYVTLALRSDDAAGDAARLASEGRAPGALSEVVRRRPDGTVVRWPVVLPGRLGPSLAPFLIEHAPDEPERAARLAAGGVRLASVTIPIPDPAATAAAWLGGLGLPAASEVIAVGTHAIVLRDARSSPGAVVLALSGVADGPRSAFRGGVEIRVG